MAESNRTTTARDEVNAISPPGSRWQVVLANLIYPAFLGNLIYLAFEDVFRDHRFLFEPAGLLVTVLIVHYVFDFAYTVIEISARRNGAFEFVAGMGIVFALYMSVRTALLLHDKDADVASIVGAVTLWVWIMKTLAVCIEIADGYRSGRTDRLKNVEIATDLAFFLFYAALILFAIRNVSLLAFVVLLDAAAYVVHSHLRRAWSRQSDGRIPPSVFADRPRRDRDAAGPNP